MLKISNTKIIFIVIAIWYAVGNFIWWQIHTPILPSAISSKHFLDIFTEGNLFYNAPLLTYIMRFMFYIFGKEYFDLIVIFINYIFFLIPLYFIYKIGTELKDKETGNIAMILFAMVPAIYGLSRFYGHQDYHIMTAITFNIYCLIMTDYFKSKKWSIIYGISVGFGLMIKDQFLPYFFIPFLYIGFISLKQNIKLTNIVNILLSVLIGSLISGWHYFRTHIIRKILSEPISEPGAPIFSFDSIRVMTTGLWEELLSPPIFLLFLIGLIYFIWKYKHKYKYIILLWIFVPWSIILFMLHLKLAEYGAGFIPAMVLIGSIFLSAVKIQKIKNFILVLVIITGILQYIDFSYAINTKLFNRYFKYKNYKVMYYNKYNDFIIYHDEFSKKTKQIVAITNYLKQNDLHSNIFIKEYKETKNSIELSELIIFMHVNNFNNINYDNVLFFPSIDNIDIVIKFYNDLTPEQEIKNRTDILYINKSEEIYRHLKKNFDASQKKLIQREKTISTDFYKISSLYLDNIKEDRNKISILKRKTEVVKE
ncbi:MAG: glycosyltransferase family 39 protein [Endomicrobiia bacterium]